ncbi:SixA phosphatase family protein [Noviherbaspirillum pedocola]|uniref:Histidine phosphatase family protein n=1 Tax=Noviherbaspirillum pedocola TaxID=2801341 RepID=A0A934W8F1_9BURK|nr:histidine phosphatase family protein [Noviherbaspirillum pedocola]MBK4737500.1 histidine phosphatase family protein [Noviherbaspirillum pedocola]
MELILWRHAEAVPGTPDADRPLTEAGKRQAAAMAAWLRPRLPAGIRILVSPATRARQTADALGQPYELCDAITKEQPATELMNAADWPSNPRHVMLVGHQPAFGELVAMILGTSVGKWDMAKGGIWWFSDRQETEKTEVFVKAVLGPEMLLQDGEAATK